MNKKNILKITINVLFIISWLTILGTIITTFLLKDFVSAYNLGSYMITIGTIDMICFIIIFVKAKSSKYFN